MQLLVPVFSAQTAPRHAFLGAQHVLGDSFFPFLLAVSEFICGLGVVSGLRGVQLFGKNL